MKSKKLYCYIEEYTNDEGRRCARVRDKDSNKRVEITHNNLGVADKLHFLNFIKQAKINKQIIQDNYCILRKKNIYLL